MAGCDPRRRLIAISTSDQMLAELDRLESLPQKFGGKNTEGGDPIPPMTKDHRETRESKDKRNRERIGDRHE